MNHRIETLIRQLRRAKEKHDLVAQLLLEQRLRKELAS